MLSIALDMLFGNKAKLCAAIFGTAFSTLLVTQQGAIFCGAMLRTTAPIREVQDAPLWVMRREVEFLDDAKPLPHEALYRVRGIAGVDWAAPLAKGLSRLQMRDGRFQQVVVFGVDDDSLIGGPQKMLMGSLADLSRPDAAIIDADGFQLLWPGEPLALGKEFEINERRVVVVGICKVTSSFILSNPVIYTRYSQALKLLPSQRQAMNFVLAKARAGESDAEVCLRIERETGLKALPREEFEWMTMMYYLRRTGVAINFGTTILLGFVIGVAIAGQTFYTFTIDNLRHFGTFKAMGLGNGAIVLMIFTQAAVISFIGYGLGVGLASLFGRLAMTNSKLAFFLPWHVLLVSGASVLLIALSASVLSAWRALALEPAVVFRS